MTNVHNEMTTSSRNQSISIKREYMYIIGGYAGWPRDDERWNGERTRNDVWKSLDGKNWKLVMPPKGQNTMPFVGRGWHACTTWHDPNDRSSGVRKPFKSSSTKDNAIKIESRSKIFISGGAYMGSKGNSEVYTLEGYVDMFWSYDASKWYKLNYEEGHGKSLYSTNEWASTLISGQYKFNGKWGHKMVSLPVDQDLNMDNTITKNESVYVEFCSGSQTNAEHCTVGQVHEVGVPTLFIIGGDTTDGGPIVNDVFISKPGG